MEPAAEPDEELLTLLDDENVRTILVETREESQSVEALSNCCGADDSTVYRLVDRLQDRNLLIAHQELDPDGHHYKTYSARLERVEIEFTNRASRLMSTAVNWFRPLYAPIRGIDRMICNNHIPLQVTVEAGATVTSIAALSTFLVATVLAVLVHIDSAGYLKSRSRPFYD